MSNPKLCLDTTSGLMYRFHYTFHSLTQIQAVIVLDQVAAILLGRPKPTIKYKTLPPPPPPPPPSSTEGRKILPLSKHSLDINLATTQSGRSVPHAVYQYVDSTTRTFRASAWPGPARGTNGADNSWHIIVDTGTDDMFGRPQILCMNLPEDIAKETAQVLQKTYEEALVDAANEELEDEASDNVSPESSEWEDDEFQDGIRVDAIDDVPGLPPALQLSSRIPMVKDKAKKITIDEKGKKKADGVVGTTVQGNAAYGQKGKMELRSTIDICQKHEATGRSKTSSAPAGPAPKGGHFEISKPPFKHVCPQAEKKALTSSAAILREEVQRLAAANPSMVSMMQSNSLQATQQSQKRDIRGKTISQSVLAKSAAQTTAPQPKQTQPTNRPSSLQLKAGSTGSSSTSAAPAATNTPPAKQPDQLLQLTPAPLAQTPAPLPMWIFTGRSGGPPTPSPPSQIQRAQPPPVPAASNEGQSYASAYSDDEFLHNYATYRYVSMEAMTDYMERSLLHSCRRRNCLQASGYQPVGTFRFYRPPPVLTFQRPYGPGLAEGAIPPRRREEGRKIKKSYYD